MRKSDLLNKAKCDKDLHYAGTVLHGLPAGGWPETQQAVLCLEGHLPFQRKYTTSEFIEACYYLDKNDRFRSRLYE